MGNNREIINVGKHKTKSLTLLERVSSLNLALFSFPTLFLPILHLSYSTSKRHVASTHLFHYSA